MSKATCGFTVKDGKPGPVTVTDGELPDGSFVIGWGISEKEETLIVMYSEGKGQSTLKASATTYFPKLSANLKALVEEMI